MAYPPLKSSQRPCLSSGIFTRFSKRQAIGPASFAITVYQITGLVLEIKDNTFVVQKGKDKREITRGKNTKITGDLKVGSKVIREKAVPGRSFGNQAIVRLSFGR